MPNNASSDNSSSDNTSSDNTKPEIFERASEALQRALDEGRVPNDPAPRKEPTAK